MMGGHSRTLSSMAGQESSSERKGGGGRRGGGLGWLWRTKKRYNGGAAWRGARSLLLHTSVLYRVGFVRGR
jgi:hypothetical protein